MSQAGKRMNAIREQIERPLRAERVAREPGQRAADPHDRHGVDRDVEVGRTVLARRR